MTEIAALAAALAANPNVTGKRDIDAACGALGLTAASPGRPGDDAAALPDGAGGWLLFAAEGFMNDFVADAPWFAGWCAVMVNVSDILAMGGRPMAVVDTLWAPGEAEAAAILSGMRAASEAYGVPIVGGHSNLRTDRAQLGAAVLGRAEALLTSFDARPGDALVCAVDLRGRHAAGSDNFPAFLDAPPDRLRGDMELMPGVAEAGLAHAAKDISQGGIAGTALMLAECSGVGIELNVAAVPAPPGVAPARWLASFPSFGFLLATRPDNVAELTARFHARDIAAAAIGRVTGGSAVTLAGAEGRATLWDHAADRYLGLAPEAPAHA